MRIKYKLILSFLSAKPDTCHETLSKLTKSILQ